MSTATFFWHDYETFGANPVRDRPVQFAGVRSNVALEEVGEPVLIYCKPPEDYLPDPDACLITGITPQTALERGLSEREFIARISAELSRPGTCGVGYNSIRFDDEFTRHALYRNFYDPYEREWRNSNSRWDIIDLMRMARALRPEGIEWADRDDGRPSFKLQDLTRANGIAHADAHDALSDARATLALARLLRERQPRLFEHALLSRDKSWVKRQLNIVERKPVLHISSRFPAENGCAALVVPVAIHPSNANSIITCNLLHDPEPLARLDAHALKRHLYTPTAELPPDATRVPLKEIHVNRSPMLAPASALSPEIAARLGIDVALCRANLERLNAIGDLPAKLREVYAEAGDRPPADPEWALYSGGFVKDADKQLFPQLRGLDGAALARQRFHFADERMDTLLFRYRARNFPQSLSEDERAQWRVHCQLRWFGEGFNYAAFCGRIAALRTARGGEPHAVAILDALQQYGSSLCEAA